MQGLSITCCPYEHIINQICVYLNVKIYQNYKITRNIPCYYNLTKQKPCDYCDCICTSRDITPLHGYSWMNITITVIISL